MQAYWKFYHGRPKEKEWIVLVYRMLRVLEYILKVNKTGSVAPGHEGYIKYNIN
jgi:hypothetical protein